MPPKAPQQHPSPRWFPLLAMGIVLLFTGCVPEFNMQGHDSCEVDSDCLSGKSCVSGRCIEGVSVDLFDGQDEEVGDLEDLLELPKPDQVQDQDSADIPPPDTSDQVEEDLLTGADQDQDLVDDGLDNCPKHFNPEQEDYDLNGEGDICQTHEHTGLVITEVHVDPEAELGAEGNGAREWQRQYIEIYNANSHDIDLSGFRLVLKSGVSVTLPADGDQIIPSGDFFVVSALPVITLDGSPARGFLHNDSSFVLTHWSEGDGTAPYEIITLEHPLLDRAAQPFVFDEVKMTQAGDEGTSFQLNWSTATGILPAVANNSHSSWCTTWYAPGFYRDGGTPGDANLSPCFSPSQADCASAQLPLLPLNQPVFGDLKHEEAPATNTNYCRNVVNSLALASDQTYRIEFAEASAVTIRFDPMANVDGDQSSGNVVHTPWYAILYWRDDCPTDMPPPVESSCVEPADQSFSFDVVLPAGETFISIDGLARATGMPYEEGRFTLAVLER